MATNVADDQLEHLIMCAVCLEHLKSPKMLYCGHTFCKLCLTSIVAKNKKRDILSCPECRSEHKIPPAGIDGFPDNRTAAAFVELYQNKAGGPSGMHCLECGRPNQTKKCDHCQKSLCPECADFHAKQLLTETKRLADILQKEVNIVSQRYFETKEQHTQQLQKSRDEAKQQVVAFCSNGSHALKAVQDKWMQELSERYELEQNNFGATEEEMEVKIVEIMSQLDMAESKSEQPVDIANIMDLNRECRKRIAQLGEIKGFSGESATKIAARRIEFRHVTDSTFVKNFLGLGKILVTTNGDSPKLSLTASGDASSTYRSSRAGKCFNVDPKYHQPRCNIIINRSTSGEYGELMYPWGLAVTKDDQVIVVDDGNQRIQFFDTQGNPLRYFESATSIQQTEGGLLQHQNSLSSMAAAAAGSGGETHKQTSGGNAGGHTSDAAADLPPSFKYISGITVDDANRLCICEEETARLYFYSVGGELEQVVELDGVGVKPRGVCLDIQDNIYVSDVENGCVFKYNSNGELLLTFGGRNSFLRPSFVALSPDEEKLVVSDTGNNKITIISSQTGEVVTTIGGSKGHHDLMFDGPCGIAVDAAGNICVVDSGNNRIQVITMVGTYVTEISLPWFMDACDRPGGFRDISILSTGQFALTDHVNHRLVIL